MLEVCGAAVGGDGVPEPLAGGEDAQCAVGHGLIGGEDLAALGVGHGLDGAVVQIGRAELENLVGRALGVLDYALRRLVDGAHHLAHGVEGCLAHPGLGLLERGLAEAEAVGVVDEGALCRLADGDAALVLLRVGTQAHCGGEELLVVAVVVDDGHLVLGEGAGLIRADDLGAAEGLDGGQAADYGVAPGHVRDAYREHHGDDRGQALGYGGDGQGDGYHEAVEHDVEVEPARAEYLHGEYDDADAEHEPGEDLGELAELDLQRGLTLLGARERVGDLAHLGLHAGGGDDHGAAAVDDGGAHVAHVLAVAEGHIGAVLEVDDVDELVDGDALAGEGGLLYLEAGAVEYAAVGGNGVARLKVDYVAHHELGAGHDAELAVAHDLAGGGGHGLQGLYGLFRLVFLIDAEHGVDYDDGHDDDDICKALALGAKDAGYGAYRRGGYEDDYHRVGHLREEALY